MTSRTIDIHCLNCRTYLHSLWPNETEDLGKSHYCTKKKCLEAATAAKLAGDEVKVVKD